MSIVGDNIRKLRIHRGLSQTELAEAIGESKQLLYKYESGAVTNIPIAKIEAIARALRCSPESLVGWEEQKPPLPEEDEFPQVRMIARAGRKMSEEDREKMLQLLKVAFPDKFDD
ncbi:MAG: helix-turn-helix transcriptional regulator [Oscillospiraceae bacterium]|nr:helix-turn-helix transcriptional regulator [Oscillospiraceae bacterium]